MFKAKPKKRGPGWGLKNNYNPAANILGGLGGRRAAGAASAKGVVRKDGRGGAYLDWHAQRPENYEIGKKGLEKRSKAANWQPVSAKRKARKKPLTLLGGASLRKKHEADVPKEKLGSGTGLLKG